MTQRDGVTRKGRTDKIRHVTDSDGRRSSRRRSPCCRAREMFVAYANCYICNLCGRARDATT